MHGGRKYGIMEDKKGGERMKRQFCPYCMNPIEPGEPCASCGLTEGTYTPSPHHLPPGTVLADRYLVGRVLGEGGFGITYIGCDLRLELRVAIKEYYPGDRVSRNSAASLSVSSYTGDLGRGFEAGRERFIREARLMARMDKTPQIVAVRDFFQANNTAYIVMEYVDGTTFKELVAQRGGRLSAGELLPLVEPLFSALDAMHKLGLIHRDISPDNLMLENGGVRLLDFGCARESSQGVNTMTIVLKHGYSPIEQYQHKGQGPWTDVYSLAATLYYCLTGKTPPQALDRICDEELTPPRQLGADLTPEQEKALLRGMGLRRSQRFASVVEFHAALYKGAAASGPDGGAAAPAESGAEPGPEAGPAAEPEAGAEPAAPTGEAGAAEELPAGEPAAEDGPEQGELPGAEPARTLPAFVRRYLWPIVGGAAALAACVVLFFWAPWKGILPLTPPPGPTATAGTSQGGALEPGPASPRQFSADASSEENGAALLSQMADDSISAIHVPMGVWADVEETVTLTKPLTISELGGVSFNGGVTVAQGGRIEAAGELNIPVLLRTVDGGTVSVADSGNLYSQMIWLADKGDLTCAEQGDIDIWGGHNPAKEDIQGYERSHYLVFNEERLFAGAVHVTTEEEFARVCEDGAAIVVDHDLTLTRQYWPTAPILVAEGVTLNAPCPDPGQEEEGNCTLEMQHGAILVNHGTVTGRVAFRGVRTGDDGQWLGEDPCALVNFGTLDASLWGEMGAVINLGTMTVREVLQQTALTNLGSLTFDGMTEAMGNGWGLAGTVTVASGAELALYGGTGVNCFGRITLEGGLRNYSQVNLNAGVLTVKGAERKGLGGGSLENFGGLRLESAALVQTEAGAEMLNHGIVQCSGAVSHDFPGEGRVIQVDYGGANTRHVASEPALRAALADDRCDLVVWDGYEPDRKIDLDGGPLTVTKGLVLRGGMDNPVDFNAGGLTLSGENAFFISDNADFHGHELAVEGGAAWLDGDTRNRGGVTVDGGMVFFSGGSGDTQRDARIGLSNGGVLMNGGGMELAGCAVDVGQNSAFYSYSHLGLHNCAVTNGGRLESFFGNLEQEGGSLVNSGELCLIGWEDYARLGGEVRNRGEMAVGGRQRVSGTLVNEEDGVLTLEWEDCPLRVSGRLDNRGAIRGARGTYVETVDGGSFTGNQAVYD